MKTKTNCDFIRYIHGRGREESRWVRREECQREGESWQQHRQRWNRKVEICQNYTFKGESRIVLALKGAGEKEQKRRRIRECNTNVYLYRPSPHIKIEDNIIRCKGR